MITLFIMVDGTMSALRGADFRARDGDLWIGEDLLLGIKAGIPARLIRKILFFSDEISYGAWRVKQSNPLGLKN